MYLLFCNVCHKRTFAYAKPTLLLQTLLLVVPDCLTMLFTKEVKQVEENFSIAHLSIRILAFVFLENFNEVF